MAKGDTYPAEAEVYRSDRLTIRPLTAADAQAYVEHTHANKQDLDAVDIYVPTDLNDVLTKIKYASPEGGEDYGIWEGEQLVGGIDLFSEVNRDPQEPKIAWIAYWIDKAHRGKGIAKEVVRGVVDHAFGPLGFATIKAGVKSHNVASQKTLEAIGFIHTNTHPKTGSFTYTLEKPETPAV